MGARFQPEDGPEDICGGQCNVDCLKPYKRDPRPAKLPPLAQHHRERLAAIRAEIDQIARNNPHRGSGVVL